jgi:hypothetical protein
VFDIIFQREDLQKNIYAVSRAYSRSASNPLISSFRFDTMLEDTVGLGSPRLQQDTSPDVMRRTSRPLSPHLV